MEVTFKLNQMYNGLFSRILPIQNSDLTNTVTTANSNVGAFSLNEPGIIKKQEFVVKNEPQSPKTIYEQKIIRVAIPYFDAYKASQDFEWGYEYFSVVKHELLKKIAENGLEYNQLSFLRPGLNTVFTDLENFAAVEVRLYCTKELEISQEVADGSEQQ